MSIGEGPLEWCCHVHAKPAVGGGVPCGSTNAGTAHRRGLGLYQHDAYAVKLAHLGDAGGQGTAKGTTSKFTGTKHREGDVSRQRTASAIFDDAIFDDSTKSTGKCTASRLFCFVVDVVVV